MMMALDMFVFEIGTLPYQKLQQNFEWRFAQAERFGARPASQFIGVGAEKISLTGALHFDHGIGSWSSIHDILEMADAGEAYTLTSGAGEVMGDYFIRKFDLGQDMFLVDGVARRGDFTLELERAA
jgi:phage protein U